MCIVRLGNYVGPGFFPHNTPRAEPDITRGDRYVVRINDLKQFTCRRPKTTSA